ncbi:MAG: hypothetical protein MJZ12_01065 [Prevotella sp.]|nr:hypothetical protein [Prevotella sp.]
MTVGELYDMLLSQVKAKEDNEGKFLFDTGIEGAAPLAITTVDLDQDGDVCVECDSRCPSGLGSLGFAHELRKFDDSMTVYFVKIAADGTRSLCEIKDDTNQ